MPGFRHRPIIGRLALIAALAGSAWSPRAVLAQAMPPGVEPPRPSEQVMPIVAKNTKVMLTELQTRILELSNKIRFVDGHDPDVLTIQGVSEHRIRLKAEKAGVTSFSLTDEFDNSYTIEVFVDADVRQLQAYIGRLFPGSAIEVIGLNGGVVLRGWVTEPAQIPQIIDVAKKFSPDVLNQMSLGGVSQIQLQVKVMEVQRSKLRQLGFNFMNIGQNGYFASTPGALAPINSATLPFGGPPSITVNPTALGNPTMQFAITGDHNIFAAYIEAIETNSLAKVLADTALVVNSGRPATLVAGGSFPVLVPQQLGTVTIQYRDFGVRMEAVANVLGNGRLRLQVAPEVSERDVSSAVVVNGFAVPGITLRRVNTEVEMRFGETLMLGGLILQRETETRNKVPFLGDLPWIGSAFGRRRSEVGETELLIMLTPQMAAPVAACQLPITGPGTNTESPASHEFYFDGHVEVPNYNPPPDTISGMVDPRLIPPPYVPGPPMGEPVMPPAAAPADSLSPTPVDVTRKTAKADSSVTQTSGVKEADSKGGATVGTINPFRTSRKRPSTPEAPRGASVKSNAGDDLRNSSRNGHSAETESTTVKPRRRLELTDSSFTSPDAKTGE